ncbi:head-tail connector protein [Cyclobacterium plantarum]|uniref:Phage gp6-like head-tail connector protein n=1 Tax=Cyclobacterium plantarum TaxID=2716263 RepID=A0ABX0H7U8_9BACT|nr:head-tail connector protein [Cyclobacterium plantarum]NHE57959.1 phage gp6-like head-tail connector protein [Cyclobacterium plantarum]
MIAKLSKKSNQTILSLEDAKEHLRILHSHEDLYLNSLLYVVTDTLENELDSDLVDTEYVFSIYEKVKVNESILFPNPPIVQVKEVKVYNDTTLIESGISYTNSDEYIVFSELPLEFTRIEITYKKGYEDKDDIPKAIKQAALLFLTDLYMNRGSIVIGKTVFHLEKTIDRLIQPYRKVKFS